MQVGDLVRAQYSEAVGLVVDVIQKKVWRTDSHGKKIDWNKVDPEPHAVVLYSHNEGTVDIPIIDLEVTK
mgnify:CR=1 FL=1